MLGGERKGKTLHDFCTREIDIFWLILDEDSVKQEEREFGKIDMNA